jgi:predicted transcriptional regulator
MRRDLVSGVCGLACAAFLFSAAPGARAAELPCDEAIGALSRYVLDGREVLPPLRARRLGAEAGYLAIRYGPLPAAETEALLDRLDEAGIIPARDLIAAWYVSERGLAGAQEALGEEALAAAGTATGISLTRALLLAGETDAVLSRIAPDDSAAPSVVYTAVLDQDDAFKAALAEAAEAAGLVDVAAGLVATERDANAWKAFAAGVADPATLERLVATYHWLPAVMGNSALPRPPGAPGSEVNRALLEETMINVALQPEREFLMAYANYTGLMAEAHAASEAVREALETGAIPYIGTFDEGWLVAYRALLAGAEPQAAETLWQVPVSPARHLRATVGDTIDWIIAVERLGPYAMGGGKGAPGVPDEVSADFAATWPEWVAVAEALRVDPLDPALREAESFPIAAELILARSDLGNDLGTLVSFFEASEATAASVEMANDFAMRLDRMCGAYLWQPSESILLAGQPPIFVFD